MTEPTTFRALAGLPTRPGPVDEAALILIDCQREYVDGAVPVPGIGKALERAGAVLDFARAHGMPVFHVMHRGQPGGAVFNPDGPFCDIVAPVTPRPGEPVVAKSTPNAFATTDLGMQLAKTGRKEAVVVGFMTHNCVSATVRGAFDLGYRCTVVADAAATRDLPDGHGGTIPAGTLHRAELAALADRVAVIVDSVDGLEG